MKCHSPFEVIYYGPFEVNNKHQGHFDPFAAPNINAKTCFGCRHQGLFWLSDIKALLGWQISRPFWAIIHQGPFRLSDIKAFLGWQISRPCLACQRSLSHVLCPPGFHTGQVYIDDLFLNLYLVRWPNHQVASPGCQTILYSDDKEHYLICDPGVPQFANPCNH